MTVIYQEGQVVIVTMGDHVLRPRRDGEEWRPGRVEITGGDEHVGAAESKTRQTLVVGDRLFRQALRGE